MAPRPRLRWCQDMKLIRFERWRDSSVFPNVGSPVQAGLFFKELEEEGRNGGTFLFYQKCIQHRNFVAIWSIFKCLSLDGYLKNWQVNEKLPPCIHLTIFHTWKVNFSNPPPKRPEKIAGIRKLEEWDRDWAPTFSASGISANCRFGGGGFGRFFRKRGGETGLGVPFFVDGKRFFWIARLDLKRLELIFGCVNKASAGI